MSAAINHNQSASLSLGHHSVVFNNMRWWAQGGLIHWENQDTGAFGSLTVRDALQRAKALNDMLGNTRGDPGLAGYADQLQMHRDYIDGMVELCEEAQRQGRPDDPRHLKQLIEQRRNGRIVVPTSTTRM